jgi:hypothetical protein
LLFFWTNMRFFRQTQRQSVCPKNSGLFKKQQLTGLLCERDARCGCGERGVYQRVRIKTKLEFERMSPIGTPELVLLLVALAGMTAAATWGVIELKKPRR